MHLTFDSFLQHRKFYKRYLILLFSLKDRHFSVISRFDVFLLISWNVLKVVVWNGGWERRTIFLLFPQDGSLYLPLPDIQQFIVEYRETSENVGRSWKMSVLEVPEAMKFLSIPRDTNHFCGQEVFPGPNIRPHTPTFASQIVVGVSIQRAMIHPELVFEICSHAKVGLLYLPLMHNSFKPMLHQLNFPQMSKSNVTQRCIWRRGTLANVYYIIKMFMHASWQRNPQYSWSSQNWLPCLFLRRLHHYTFGHLWLCWTI